MTEEKTGAYLGRRSSRRRRSSGIDNFLIKLAAAFVVVLLLTQCFLLSSRTRQFFSIVDRMEGDQITFSSDLAAADETSPNDGKRSPLSLISEMTGKFK